MSVRFLNNSGGNNTNVSAKTFSSRQGFTPVTEPWVRNPSWPVISANSGDNKIVGLYAVYPGDGVGNGGNFFAMTNSGAYTINYGDGTTTNYTSGSTAYYEFNYNDADLSGTDAPVTFTAATNTVNRTAHGYNNGDTVRFYNIVTTTGVSENTPYYVVNATANTFQVAALENGSALALTNDGSATLLPYKIAVITITPQAGQNLNSVAFYVKHNQSGLANGYSTGWLDIEIALPSCTILSLGNSGTNVRHLNLEQVKLNQLDAITSFNNLFYNCYSLRNVVISSDISTVTNMSTMFYNCYSLTSVPLFNTAAVTSMSSMFYNCYSLTTVPLFNTAAVTNMSTMFGSCYSLTSVPLFNTAAVTSMSSMFSGCNSLTSVPLFNTAAVTNMSTMFTGCYSLTSVPLFNTVAVTNMSNMFSSCVSLTSVPLFNTAAVTSMSGMFGSCYSLTSVPLFNTAAVTSIGNMFSYCYSLTTVPLFNTAAVTSMSGMFGSCDSLTTVPLFNTAAVTNMDSMFSSCVSLTSVPLFNTVAVTNMSNMFSSCTSLTSVPLFNTAAVTNMGSMFTGCYSLTSVPALVTTSVTSSSNFSSMFTNCNSLARIQAKNFRFTFSVANCKLSATALNEIYTNLPTVTAQTITVSGNYGTVADDPTIATAKGWTVTG